MTKSVAMQELTRDFVAHVAHIMGDQSAAAQALAEYDRRLAAGESVKIYRGQGSLFVGP